MCTSELDFSIVGRLDANVAVFTVIICFSHLHHVHPPRVRLHLLHVLISTRDAAAAAIEHRKTDQTEQRKSDASLDICMPYEGSSQDRASVSFVWDEAGVRMKACCLYTASMHFPSTHESERVNDRIHFI